MTIGSRRGLDDVRPVRGLFGHLASMHPSAPERREGDRFGHVGCPVPSSPAYPSKVADQASIRIIRTRPNVWDFLAYLWRPPAYEVLIDGAVAGEVSGGHDDAFDVSPGRHEVEVNSSFGRWSQRRAVTVEGGSEVALRCHTTWFGYISLK